MAGDVQSVRWNDAFSIIRCARSQGRRTVGEVEFRDDFKVVGGVSLVSTFSPFLPFFFLGTRSDEKLINSDQWAAEKWQILPGKVMEALWRGDDPLSS